MTNATVGEVDLSKVGTETDITTSSANWGYGVHHLYATENQLVTFTTTTQAAKWSQIDNWSPSTFVSGPWSLAVLNLGGGSFDFDVEGLTARSVAICGAEDVSLTASKLPTGVSMYDLTACTARSDFGFDPGEATVRVGKATYASVASTTAQYVIGAGQRLYVSDPSVAATMKITQEGVLGYSGVFDIMATPNPQAGEGLEYAGTHTLATPVGNCAKPLYFSGTISVPHNKDFVKSTTSDLHIIDGETVLMGKALLSHDGNNGANIMVSGGVLKGSSEPTSDPYIYWGGWSGTINLAVNGTGRWEAAIKPYATSIDAYAVTISVSEGGVFAPAALAFNDKTTTKASTAKLVMADGGTFEMPENVPYWLPQEVTAGVATNVIWAHTSMAAPLTVDDGATLVIRSELGAKLSLTKISGLGLVIVDGAILDLSSSDYSTFGGTIQTVNGGSLLPKGLGEGRATVNVNDTVTAESWTALPWKGFFGAPVDPSSWQSGELEAGFAGSGRVEVGEIGGEVRAASVTVPAGVTVAVAGATVIPGKVANEGTIEYTGEQTFTEAREGLGGQVVLAGRHTFTIGVTGTGFKPVLGNVAFSGTTVFTNTCASGLALGYTDSKSPLAVVGGRVDFGNLMIGIAQEDGARRWSADIAGDGVVCGGYFRWGPYWWSKCDIGLDGTSRFESPMGPWSGQGAATADASMRVTVGGSAVFAPTCLKTVKKDGLTVGDYEADDRANDLEVVLGREAATDVAPAFELPEVVPSWVKVRAVSDGARLVIPSERSVAFNGTATSEANVALLLAGTGVLSHESTGSFAAAAIRLDGATVAIADEPLVCDAFDFGSGAFELVGKKRGPRVLVRTSKPMSSAILTALPPIKDRKYGLTEDGKELFTFVSTGLVIIVR